MDNEDRITVDPETLGGKPVIKGTRIPVYLILDLIATGLTIDKILEEYPELTRDDIQASLTYASKLLRREAIVPLEA